MAIKSDVGAGRLPLEQWVGPDGDTVAIDRRQTAAFHARGYRPAGKPQAPIEPSDTNPVPAPEPEPAPEPDDDPDMAL